MWGESGTSFAAVVEMVVVVVVVVGGGGGVLDIVRGGGGGGGGGEFGGNGGFYGVFFLGPYGRKGTVSLWVLLGMFLFINLEVNGVVGTYLLTR